MFCKRSWCLLYPLHSKIVGGVYCFHSICMSVCPSVCPTCHVRSVTPTVLDRFFPYQAQMITSMKGGVVHNDLWPWPISSRSFSHDFSIKLLKYVPSCRVHFTAHTVLDVFFPYLAQMITSMRTCVACNDFWPWLIFLRSFSHDFAIKLPE